MGVAIVIGAFLVMVGLLGFGVAIKDGLFRIAEIMNLRWR
jgi:hypothetical protein